MSIFRKHKTSADRSADDRKRHKQKIEKAIKEGIHDIVADESIIGQDGKKKFRIPVRGIKEYRFIYGDNSNSGVGSSPGHNVNKGSVVSRNKKEEKGDGSGKPGNQKGEEYYDVEITLDELAQYLFDDLELPDLERKTITNITGEKNKKHGYRKKGIRPRLDKKRTLINKIKRRNIHKRNGLSEDEDISFNERDIVYKHIKSDPKENSNAVLFFVMDTSGSMTKEKKYLARSFYFLIYQFIRYRYKEVDIVFISHDVDAKEVSEEDFFQKGSAGGTLVSPAIDKVRSIIDKMYHPDQWNIYAFHCSDGDNWMSDNSNAVSSTLMLKNYCQLYCYCEIQPYEELSSWRSDFDSSLMKYYTPIVDNVFKIVEIRSKEDIWVSFKQLFGGKND